MLKAGVAVVDVTPPLALPWPGSGRAPVRPSARTIR